MASAKQGGADPEIRAINVILQALRGLDGEAIQRVLEYVAGRLSLSPATISLPSPLSGAVQAVPAGAPSSTRQVSVRDLAEEKRPSSAKNVELTIFCRKGPYLRCAVAARGLVRSRAVDGLLFAAQQ
jgi:hypothetical protein